MTSFVSCLGDGTGASNLAGVSDERKTKSGRRRKKPFKAFGDTPHGSAVPQVERTTIIGEERDSSKYCMLYFGCTLLAVYRLIVCLISYPVYFSSMCVFVRVCVFFFVCFLLQISLAATHPPLKHEYRLLYSAVLQVVTQWIDLCSLI